MIIIIPEVGGETSKYSLGDKSGSQEDSPSKFTAIEIKKLHKRFEQLDTTHCGFIRSEDLDLIPELSLNPLCKRVVSLCDPENRNEINFTGFVKLLWVFSSRATKQEKLDLTFKCYDTDADNEISPGDMFGLLRDIVGQQLPDNDLMKIAEELIKKDQPNANINKLTKGEFFDVMTEEVLLENMTVSVNDETPE
ncbi:calcineurin regulatory subunit B [Reticulomyxa filosa]|uniref:Calcineurin regulatory subunit B n=1 Tax=Reticulomyxa filosa TaxID=46433 RepID=X6NLU2_RETFI|nr:calcineurin regulatory subunit B [Reticulomyxa filosa]|eukprot:ETO27255.1 calcineurin regulatory subunit B [Reticulomyxa filosa]